MGRGPRVRLASERCPGLGGAGRGGADRAGRDGAGRGGARPGRGRCLRYLASQPVFTRVHLQCQMRRCPGLDPRRCAVVTKLSGSAGIWPGGGGRGISFCFSSYKCKVYTPHAPPSYLFFTPTAFSLLSQIQLRLEMLSHLCRSRKLLL